MKTLNHVHLNGLRALEAVGRLGSLQAAALEFGVSIGAISQQIRKAEAQLDCPIFERGPRRLELTETGRPILVRLTEGFDILTRAVALAGRQDNSILTISVAPVFAARWLVQRLDSFSARFPDIGLRIDATTKLVDPALSDVDICIRVGSGNWRDVRSEKILSQQVFPVCAPQLAALLKTPADLLSAPIVVDGRAMFGWDVWLDEARLAENDLNVRHIFNEASLCLDAAIAGQGVMLAWQTLAADALAEGRLVAPFPIRAETGFGHYFVTAKEGREPGKTRAFKAWMKDELALSIAKLDAGFTSASHVPEL